VNAMLLNEFLKAHRKMQEQEETIGQHRKDFQATISKLEATIARQQKGMEAVAARLQEQDSKIQKVSPQLELNRPVPQIVLSNQ
jgi:septal ring factor EnvC (AmiA/AmiB activator)